MNGEHSARPPLHRWAIALGIVVFFVLLLVAGLFLPIPIVEIGSAALAGRFPWILAATLALALLAGIVFVRHPSVIRGIIAGGALLCVGGAVALTIGQLSLARDNDVELDWPELLLTADYGREPDSWHVYDQRDGEPLHVGVWLPPEGPEGAPVIFMTHGGGWISGSIVEGGSPLHASWFADQGYLVVGANYSLADEGRHLWDVQERQIGCALAWVGEHVPAMGADVSRLGAIGDSAGGNLIMQVAYKAASGELVPTCAGELPAIDAVSVIYPAPDLVSIYANDDILMSRFSQEFALDYIGGTPEEFPERYRATNPAYSATPAAPPTLAAVGEDDHLVPTAGTLAVFDAIADAGVTVEVLIVPFGEHAFDMHPGSVGTQVWHDVTLRWFAQHGAR